MLPSLQYSEGSVLIKLLIFLCVCFYCSNYEIVKHIDQVIEETNEIIADKKEQIATLESYKKSIIFEYVTGKKEIV